MGEEVHVILQLTVVGVIVDANWGDVGTLETIRGMNEREILVCIHVSKTIKSSSGARGVYRVL